MLSRIFSAVLVVLIVSPFSAPFSTCDTATLHSGRGQVQPSNALASDLRVAREIGNFALVALRPKTRIDISRMYFRPLLLARLHAPASPRSAEIALHVIARDMSSPLRI